MSSVATIDFDQVSQSLRLPKNRVETVVELLDAGNTVPFITRYRKDQTGGLDEEQIREIQARVLKLRLLAERKQTILRSIESQGKLTPELAAAIESADTTRRLEDLYLPFKPKKTTLATQARGKGLEPLAEEILAADPACADLDARAADFISTDKYVASAADALLGAGHILAEWYSERADFRGRVRSFVERTGRLVSVAIDPPSKESAREAEPVASSEATAAIPADVAADPLVPFSVSVFETFTVDTSITSVDTESAAEPSATDDVAVPAEETAADAAVEAPLEESADAAVAASADLVVSSAATEVASLPVPAAPRRAKKKKKAKKESAKDNKDTHAFRDYFNFSEPVGKVPPHRVLAINRGEKAKVLRVKVEVDVESLLKLVDELLVSADHPHADFLRGCGRDALMRLVLPSLEREIRRELTDQAETHAVDVFARNLRNLLLQPPIRERRVLAIDPGFKSGCKLVALDEFGNLLDQGVIHLIGREERRTEAKAKLIEMVKQHQCTVVAIGNGTACRETEQWISDLIASDLGELGVAYVIVNEAGASVYSTSRLGREEFPQYDATVRGAISIGRRLQDPLSELVKIDPANIGVGMYQHDVKLKHLKDSLDAVVESCVNFVGVNLNTASPALLRYVSGLNQLTAQRVFDHRTTYGPFKNREELLAVPGFGDQTFVQAAGFLKIVDGDSPFDATWIHPESYPVARQVLEKLGSEPAALADKQLTAALAQRAAEVQVEQLSTELNVGSLTLSDIMTQLVRPGRDPRENLPQPIFKHGVLKMDDLTPSMELSGTVLNVVDFGAFVDIGLKDSGLVHISQLANRYVQDPHDVVSVGDIVKVWVLEVDKQRRRVSLTMIEPGSKRQSEERRPPRRPQGQQQGQGQGQNQGRGAPRGGGTADGQAATQTSGQGGGGQRGGGGRSGRPQQHGGGGGGRRGGGGGGRPQQQSSAPPQYKPKPKPLVPLTKDMKEGKAPLRTFGDLKQFLDQKPAAEEPEAKKPD